jgi:hypothetical protein
MNGTGRLRNFALGFVGNDGNSSIVPRASSEGVPQGSITAPRRRLGRHQSTKKGLREPSPLFLLSGEPSLAQSMQRRRRRRELVLVERGSFSRHCVRDCGAKPVMHVAPLQRCATSRSFLTGSGHGLCEDGTAVSKTQKQALSSTVIGSRAVSPVGGRGTSWGEWEAARS